MKNYAFPTPYQWLTFLKQFYNYFFLMLYIPSVILVNCFLFCYFTFKCINSSFFLMYHILLPWNVVFCLLKLFCNYMKHMKCTLSINLPCLALLNVYEITAQEEKQPIRDRMTWELLVKWGHIQILLSVLTLQTPPF